MLNSTSSTVGVTPAAAANQDRLGRSLPLPKPHLFIHIPKTGGTTLSRLVRWGTGKRRFLHFWRSPTPEILAAGLRARPDVVFGHLAYGFHRWFDVPGDVAEPRHWTYACFLRDPVERIVSHYHYQRARAVAHLAKECTLAEYAERADLNMMTRLLCGAHSGAWWNHPERGYRPPDPARNPPVTETMFQLAAHRLRHEFGFVGLTERFDDSLIVMSRVLGTPLVASHHGNRSPRRGEGPDRQTRELIRRHACWDVRLYAVAKEVFEEQVAALGGDAWLHAQRGTAQRCLRQLRLLRYVTVPAFNSAYRQARAKLRRMAHRRARQ